METAGHNLKGIGKVEELELQHRHMRKPVVGRETSEDGVRVIHSGHMPWPRTQVRHNNYILLTSLGSAGTGEVTLLSLVCSLLRYQLTVGCSRLTSAGVPGVTGL